MACSLNVLVLNFLQRPFYIIVTVAGQVQKYEYNLKFKALTLIKWPYFSNDNNADIYNAQHIHQVVMVIVTEE